MDQATKVAIARELIESHPNAAKRALARRLCTENPQIFANVEAARNVVRYAMGCYGDRDRKKLGIKKKDAPIGKAGWKAAIPPSLAEPWDAVQIDGPAKVLSLSDAHIPYHSSEAITAAVAYAKKRFKPDVLLLNGDTIDFYTISRFDKNPKKRDLVREVDLTEAFLEWLSEQFPKARKVFKAGNHDERWDKYIWNHAPALWGLENTRLQDILHLADYGFEYVGDQRPIMAGKLAIFHGHELGNGANSPVNPARGAFMKTLGSVLVGHHHRTSTHAESDMWHSETATWSTGCLCDLRPEYNRVSNKWNWGFAVVEAEASGSYDVHNLRLSDEFVARAS